MLEMFRLMSVEMTASYYTIGIISGKNIVIKTLHKIETIMIYVVVVLKLIRLRINGLLRNIQGRHKV